MDVMYDGRLEVGIGAGSMPSEHSRFLGPRPMPIEERRERVEETLQIFDDLWGYGQFSFSGTHYSIDKLNGTPEPLLTITDLGRDVLTGKVDLLSLAPRTAGSPVVLGAFEQLNAIPNWHQGVAQLVRKCREEFILATIGFA